MFVGGKLKLKNAKLIKPNSTSNVQKSAKDILSKLPVAQEQEDAEAHEEEIWTEQSKTQGDGKIVSSSTTITGYGTHFKSQVESGDAIELISSDDGQNENEDTDEPQLRLVKFVLSDTSLSINSPFEPDLSKKSDYFILKLPKQVITQEKKEAEARKRKREEEGKALGEFADGVKRVDTSSSKSREELLFERMKKKGDKFC
jgi:hypothetical protein